MNRIGVNEVKAHGIRDLGLDPRTHDLDSTVAIAAAIRRAAGFLCPCSSVTLTRTVHGALEGLVPDLGAVTSRVEATLESMIAYGDLLEQREIAAEIAGHGPVLLYAAPPSFVVRSTGVALILGISPDGPSPLPADLQVQVEHDNHIRRLRIASPQASISEELRALGLLELSEQLWLKLPAAEPASEFLSRIDTALDGASQSGDVPGLLVLDPARPVRFYQGRWVAPGNLTGRFIARRRRAYGSDLWCYVELNNGEARRFLDLPHRGGRGRGCDDAWRVQAAIDAQRGEPQHYTVRQDPAEPNRMCIGLFSPVPMWAQRRWDVVGRRTLSPGCLFAYTFPTAEIVKEAHFAQERLWLVDSPSDDKE